MTKHYTHHQSNNDSNLKFALSILGIVVVITIFVTVWLTIRRNERLKNFESEQEQDQEETTTTKLKLDTENFPIIPITSDTYFELWYRSDEETRLLSFKIGKEGKFLGPDGYEISNELSPSQEVEEGDEFLITVEHGAVDNERSKTVLVRGTLGEEQGELTFAIDLSQSSGQYILTTPTTYLTADETSGIWFMTPTEDPQPTLTLPDLPLGWLYNASVEYKGELLNIGTFTQTTGRDNNNFYTGSLDTPEFPGEDFVNEFLPEDIEKPVNLTDGESRVHIELIPDFESQSSTRNCVIQFMGGVIPQNANTNETHNLELTTENLPKAFVTLSN